MRYGPAIVQDRIPGQRRHATIRFVHDQIGGGKIPVAALTAGERGIEPSVRNPTQPKRQRPDSGMENYIL